MQGAVIMKARAIFWSTWLGLAVATLPVSALAQDDGAPSDDAETGAYDSWQFPQGADDGADVSAGGDSPAGDTDAEATEAPGSAQQDAPVPESESADAEWQFPQASDEAPVQAPGAEELDVIRLAERAPAPLPEPAAGDAQSTALDDMVVTARKRQESIQEVPVAVTGFSQKDLEQRGFIGLEDIAAATPGFTFEAFMTGGAHGNPVVRGLAQQFTTARIQNVSFFLDGVYLQRQSMLNLGMVDMERIEVVKGPQNALYGRNAFAGAVNYVTRRPTGDPEGYLMAGLGDNDREEYRFSVAGPINEDRTLVGKFTTGFSRYDGHTRNDHPVADADPIGPNLRGNLGGFDDRTYSLSLDYLPVGPYRIRGSYYRSENTHETAPGYSISGVGAARFGLRFDDQNDLNCNEATVRDIGNPSVSHTGFTAYCGELPDYASDIAPRTADGIIVDPRAIGTVTATNVLTLSVEYDLTETLSVHYLYGKTDHESFTDGGASDEDPLAGRGILTNAALALVDSQNPDAYTFANTASSRPNSVLDAYSHELRLDWQFSERLRTSLGAYYSTVEDQEWTELYINDLCNASSPENIENCNEPLAFPNHLADETVVTVGVAYDQFTRQHGGRLRGEWTAFDDSIAALFGSVSYDITDTLEAALEARYAVENKRIQRFTDSFMLAPGETVTYNPPQDPVLPGFGNSLTSAIVVPRDDARYTDFTPRAIVSWDFAPQHMIYLSAAKGVKAGGFNNADSETDLTYDVEENWTYELGSKNRFFHGAVTLNAAAYYIDWKGLQGGVPPTVAGLSTSDVVKNIGGATSIGIEIESNIRLTDLFSVDLGLTYNDATYDDGVKYAAGDQNTGVFHCDGVTCPADGDVSGNQLARTSKEQYTLGLNYGDYYFGWGVNARIDTNYQSKQYITPLNLAWVPERQLTNASLKIVSPDTRWEIIGWGKNLTDEDYPANSFFIGVFNQYMVAKGPRRTYGASLKYNF